MVEVDLVHREEQVTHRSGHPPRFAIRPIEPLMRLDAVGGADIAALSVRPAGALRQAKRGDGDEGERGDKRHAGKHRNQPTLSHSCSAAHGVAAAAGYSPASEACW